MKNNECGFSTPLAMTVIFSLSLTVFSVFMLLTAEEKKLNSYKNLVDAKKEALRIIYNLEKDFQILKEVKCDTELNPVIQSLTSQYKDYRLELKDVSTGINRNIVSEKFSENKIIRDYIARKGEECLTEYGWLNPKYTDTDNVFPIVNSYPAMNIYNMQSDLLKVICEYCGIILDDEKLKRISELLSDETDIREIAKVLEVSTSHQVFDFIGLKTVFWRADFETQLCRGFCILALIPEKDNSRSIEKYILIEKEISYKGGKQ